MIKAYYVKAFASVFALALAGQACTVVTKNADDETEDDGSDDQVDAGDGDDDDDGRDDDDGEEDDDAEDDDGEEDDDADDGEEDDDAEDDDVEDDGEGDAGADDGEDDDEGDAGADDGEDDGAEGDAGADDGEDDGAEGDGGADDGEDDGAEGDGGADDGDGETTELKVGTISLTQTTLVIEGLPDPIVSASAFGSFNIIQVAAGGENECETTTVDSCTLSVCPVAEAGEGAATASAGDITFTGLSADPAMSYDDTNGFYTGMPLTELMWSESAEATVEASGSDDVPAFSIDLVLPDQITLTAPVADSASNYALSRSESLEVTWDGGGEGMVSVTLGGVTDDQTAYISCFVSSADGGVTVDSSLIAELPDMGSFSANASATASSDVGDDWLVTFSGTNVGSAGTATVSD